MLDVLGCPHCKGALDEMGAQVACPRCGLSWPVEDGIPRLTPERAVAVTPLTGA
ncbi:Trm112 family protein [Myxococcus hansupus]|uniref:Trm112 family protein n=1 Tax=Pseudomyxococcus hansupus TaxID=1297742 RepID=UPI0011874E05|nr:Trm112 family protein [Myxococcus hansupus]